MSSSDLSDLQYEALQPHLPPVKPARGRTNLNHKPILNGILWIMRTGAPWRELPERYGKWKTVYSRFRRWTKAGIWANVLLALQNQAEAVNQIDWDIHHIDSTSVRVHVDAAGAQCQPGLNDEDKAQWRAMGRSRGGLTTKVHLRVDGRGLVMTIVLSEGQRHDSKFFEAVMEQKPLSGGRKGRPRQRPKRVAADKAYSNSRIRDYLRKRAIRVTIPRKKDQRRRGSFDKEAYKKRNIVERTIGRLKRYRRLATRYDKLACTFLAFWQLGAILQWLNL